MGASFPNGLSIYCFVYDSAMNCLLICEIISSFGIGIFIAQINEIINENRAESINCCEISRQHLSVCLNLKPFLNTLANLRFKCRALETVASICYNIMHTTCDLNSLNYDTYTECVGGYGRWLASLLIVRNYCDSQ